jgi:multiple sugar transport system substrate-binding protein
MIRTKFASLIALAVSVMVCDVRLASAGEIVWWTPNWGEARAKQLAEKFTAANPGITVKLEVTTADGLPQRVLTALRSGAGPSLIEVQHGWVNGYAQSDFIISLDDALQDRADYMPAALDYVTWNSKLWAIPYRIETHSVIYNKGQYKAAGLDPDKPPQTWDELIAAAKALTKDGKFGFAITGGGEVGNTIFRSLPFIWMNGGGIVSDDLKMAIVNKPEAVAAVTFYTDFYRNKYSPSSTLQNDGTANRRLFIAESVAAYQSGQFDLGSIKKENPRIDVGAMPIPHPAGKQTAAVLGGWSYVVPKSAKNPDEIKAFLKFLNTSENQGFFTDTFPARQSAMKQPRFDDPLLASFKAMLPHGRPVPIHKNWVRITQAYFDGIQRILLDEQSVQEAMDQANEEIQALLDS